MIKDVIIIGGGPAGLTAGIYARRAGLDVLIFEKLSIGGQAGLTPTIENYPGFLSISGFELGMKMHEQATALGCETVYEDVIQLDLKSDIKKVKTQSQEYEAKSIIICSGASARKLGLAKEDEFIGKGISYCAVCDGAFFKNKVVAVVGGGNTALEDSMYLSKFAKKVYLIHRRNSFRGDEILVKELIQKCKTEGHCVEPIYNTIITELVGSKKLEGIKIKNVETNKEELLEIDGLFVAIGRKPDTELTEGQINLDGQGYIIVDEECKSNLKGVYAGGDVTNSKLKQIVTACAQGAIAGNNVAKYIKK